MGQKNQFRLLVSLIFAGIATTLNLTANAATVDLYSDSTSFISHAGPNSTIDFENLVGSTFGANYDSSTGYFAQSGITLDGVTFTGYTNGPSNVETYIVGQAAQDSSVYQINSGSADLIGGRTRTMMDFQGQNVNAVGFDFMRVGTTAYPNPLDYAIQLIFDDGSVLNEAVSISLPFDGAKGYFGFNATGKNISIINFYNNFATSYGDLAPYITFDNVSFKSTSSASAVPEPETYVMFLAGLGFVGFIARRRQLS